MLCQNKNCKNQAQPSQALCDFCLAVRDANKDLDEMSMSLGVPTQKLEKSGGNVNYYIVDVPEPKRLQPYKMEVEDIIEVLDMNFAEGTLLKALIRSCNLRKHGIGKAGENEDGVYDGDKIAYYGDRIKVQRRRKAKQASK